MRTIIQTLLLATLAISFITGCNNIRDLGLKNDQKIISKTLANGFSYTLHKMTDGEDTKISFNLLVDIGSFQEREDEKGYAHLVEHIAMLRDSKNFSYKEKEQHLRDNGLVLGQHTNAYTSYDNTWYYIDSTTLSNKHVEKNLALLKDIADGALFNNTDVNLEKEVVLQELLLRKTKENGIEEQITKAYDNDTLTKYAPIGTKDTINAANSGKLRAFYDKWYQPQFMHLIVVGDIDIAQISAKIEQIFSTLATSTNKKSKNPSPPIPNGNYFLNADDYANNEIKLFIGLNQNDYATQNTEQYQNTIYNDFIIGGIESNLNHTNDASGKRFIIKAHMHMRVNKPYLAIHIYHNKQDRAQALEFLTSELANLRANGFSKSQFDNQMGYINKRATETDLPFKSDGTIISIARSLIANIETNSKHVSAQDERGQAQYFIDNTKQSDIKTQLNTILTKDIGMLVLSDTNLSNAERNKLSDKINNFKHNNVATIANNAQEIAPNKIQYYTGKAGEITSSNFLQELNIKHVVLNNGVNAYLLQNDQEDGRVVINIVAKGGTLLLPQDLISAGDIALPVLIAGEFGGLKQAQLTQYLNQRGIEIHPSVYQYRHGLVVNIENNTNIAAAFNVLHSVFQPPKTVNQARFDYMKNNLLAALKQYASEPSGQFQQNNMDILYTKGKEHIINSITSAENITKADILKIYDLLFTDMSKFNFVIVGDFDQDNVEDLLEKYIASIKNNKQTYKQATIEVTAKNVYNRSDKNDKKQSIVEIDFFNKNIANNFNSKREMAIAASMLSNRLHDIIRMQEALTYSISAGFIYNRPSSHPAFMQVYFSTSAEKEQQTSKLVEEIIADVVKNGFTAAEFTASEKVFKDWYFNATNSNAELANYIAEDLINDGALNDMKNEEEFAKTVNLQQINTAIKKYLQDATKAEFVFSSQ